MIAHRLHAKSIASASLKAPAERAAAFNQYASIQNEVHAPCCAGEALYMLCWACSVHCLRGPPRGQRLLSGPSRTSKASCTSHTLVFS